MKLNHQIWPSYSNPDMDWDEATTEAAQNFGKTEKLIADFIIMHGAILGTEPLADIHTLRETASNYKFAYHENEQEAETAKKRAGDLLMKLKEIENTLIKQLRG